MKKSKPEQLFRRVTVDIPEGVYQEACRAISVHMQIAEIGCAVVDLCDRLLIAVLRAARDVKPEVKK